MYLRCSREEKMLTGEQLAILSGIDRSYVSKMEYGVHLPTFAVAKRISESLDDNTILEIYMQERYPEIVEYYSAKQRRPCKVEPLGDIIRKERKTKNMLVYELAIIVGVNPVYITQIEKHNKTPSYPVFDRISKALELPQSATDTFYYQKIGTFEAMASGCSIT